MPSYRKIALNCIMIILGSSVLAFGMYNVHSLSGVTEGGTLGLTLLLQYWFDVSPAISGLILNTSCYVLGWRLLGKGFIAYSFVAAAGFSVAYRVCEFFDPLWPNIGEMPLLAAVVGALFVGVGVGICVRCGGAPSGDDALGMSLSSLFKVNIKWIYLVSDLIVLLLSLTYIPLERIVYSLITVIISGQIIGFMTMRN